MNSNTPGVCIESGDRKLSWSPVKMIRTRVSDLSEDADSELNTSDVTCICFDKQSGVAGFAIADK